MVAGAVVLMLEVLGTRVIGTYYGGSLYVWTSLLTVTLVCLALGYAIGGKLADRLPRPAGMYLLVVLAGLSVLLSPLLEGVLAPLDRALGLVGGALASASILFAVPLTLLAMTVPYVIRLRTSRLAGVGTASGVVYALSTVGSVAGVLVVSLWMVPQLGTRASLLVCSATLIVAGAIGLVLSRGLRGAAAILLACVPLGLWGQDPPAMPGQLYHTESAYGDLRVLQRTTPGGRPHRMLLMNGILQTGMPLDSQHLARGGMLESDSYYLELLPYFHGDLGAGRKGILIGLAGGMFTRVMESYEIQWTAVEIDVKVAELAKAFFGYRGDLFLASGQRLEVDLSRFGGHEASAAPAPPGEADGSHAPGGPPYRGRAVLQDGRQFLLNLPPGEQVDFLVLDAYESDTIPFHMLTREFFELARRRLKSDGILAINFVGRPEGDFVTDSLLRTLTEVFGSDLVRAYGSLDPDRASEVQALTIFAFRHPMELIPQWPHRSEAGVDRLVFELEQRRLNVNRPHGRIITDDYSPIDLARAEVAMEWRRYTRARLAEMK